MSKKTDVRSISSTEVVEVTGDALVIYRSGFFSLKERRLPSGDAEARVAVLYGVIRPLVEAYEAALKSLEREVEDIEMLDDAEEKLERTVELRRKRREIDAFKYQMPVPKMKLNEKHLPRVHKGKEGDMNPSGNAGVIIALSPYFFETPTIKEDEVKAATEEEGSE
jgi:hypothetical protein